MKDAKGHGSDSRGGSTFDRLNSQRVAQGFKPMPEKNRGMHDFFDYMAGEGPKPDFMNAASATAGNGPKSAAPDVHPAMATVTPSPGHPGLGERGGVTRTPGLMGKDNSADRPASGGRIMPTDL